MGKNTTQEDDRMESHRNEIQRMPQTIDGERGGGGGGGEVEKTGRYTDKKTPI
jgi:hypothetical protein